MRQSPSPSPQESAQDAARIILGGARMNEPVFIVDGNRDTSLISGNTHFPVYLLFRTQGGDQIEIIVPDETAQTFSRRVQRSGLSPHGSPATSQGAERRRFVAPTPLLLNLEVTEETWRQHYELYRRIPERRIVTPLDHTEPLSLAEFQAALSRPCPPDAFQDLLRRDDLVTSPHTGYFNAPSAAFAQLWNSLPPDDDRRNDQRYLYFQALDLTAVATNRELVQRNINVYEEHPLLVAAMDEGSDTMIPYGNNLVSVRLDQLQRGPDINIQYRNTLGRFDWVSFSDYVDYLRRLVRYARIYHQTPEKFFGLSLSDYLRAQLLYDEEHQAEEQDYEQTQARMRSLVERLFIGRTFGEHEDFLPMALASARDLLDREAPVSDDELVGILNEIQEI